MASGNAYPLENTIDDYAIDDNPSHFEGAMIASERYRQAARDEMCILYTQIALESIDKIETSKKFARQSIEFFENWLHYVPENEKKPVKDLNNILNLIINEKFKTEDIERGLQEIKALDEKMKNDFNTARADYYKILT